MKKWPARKMFRERKAKIQKESQNAGARKLTDVEVYSMIMERAEKIARHPLFAKAVMERGLNTKEEVKDLGYWLAVASLMYGKKSG